MHIIQPKLLSKFSAPIFIILLSACGFKPIYKKENYDQVRGKVEVLVTGQNRDEIRMLSGLLEREFSYKANNHKDKPYRLEVGINESVEDFAVSRYSYSTRRKVNVNVSFRIIDNKTSKVLDQGAFNSFSSFDLSQTSDYSNEVGINYSGSNSIKILADQLIVRCAAAIEDNR